MRWSYKTVHYELKKEGLLGSAFLDESEMERSLNEYGKAGWELIALLETLDGLTAVFKQPLSLDAGSFYPRERVVDNQHPGRIASRKVAMHKPESMYAPEEGLAEMASEGAPLLDDFEIFDESSKDSEQQGSGAARLTIDVGTIRIE